MGFDILFRVMIIVYPLFNPEEKVAKFSVLIVYFDPSLTTLHPGATNAGAGFNEHVTPVGGANPSGKASLKYPLFVIGLANVNYNV